ncbi:MAG: 4Fe-4S binding protein [Synergistaceae bacterium]|nr:4Fe-4S binding protein [Synergistaceae bacterium]
MNRTVLVCCGTGCIANGSLEVAEALRRAISETKTHAIVETVIKQTGCNGFCENGPIVRIMPDDISYYKVKPKNARDIVNSIGEKPVEQLLYKNDEGTPVLSQMENPFYMSQHKTVLRNIGEIDPGNLSDYLARGGYSALKKALFMTPDAIIREVESSGLRGRGGAGFPTGRKWRTAAGFEALPKYVICNGDEGDPGAFMDRSILEGDPHSVLEGIIICALSIGALEGFLYIRDEYVLARKYVQKAIHDAESAGILGGSIMGSGKRLNLSVVRGGGAFICGESTALMASIEGRVGEPRAKYARSAQRGLWNQPTVLNNVETFANIPIIINNSGENFTKIGAENSKGTKVFALVGKVRRSGLVEVPMGVSLRYLVNNIGGGVIDGRPLKAVQIGGPSGGCIPEAMLDLPVDFDSLTNYGAMMGSGGMIVMDDRSCMVEVARYYVNFLAEESCGKCTPCREGLRQMLAILTDICEGRGKEGDLELLEEISRALIGASLCALGKSAPNPVMTGIRYFRDEYIAHIMEKHCPAGVCAALTAFEIDASVCVGCTNCKRACPTGAVTGEVKSAHNINQAACVACGACREVCRFGAVRAIKRRFAV